VVHLNDDPLDFRRQNLAVVTSSVCAARMRKRKGAWTSVYKGVRRSTDSNTRWQAKLGGTHLGSFGSEEEAAAAYDEAARRKYGVFAALNFPHSGEVSCHRDPMPLEAAA
jgi:hypothetical protein